MRIRHAIPGSLVLALALAPNAARAAELSADVTVDSRLSFDVSWAAWRSPPTTCSSTPRRVASR